MPALLNYYRRLFALFRSYQKRREIVPVPPLRLWIELSSACNLQCVMCPNRELPAAQRGEMSPGTFRRVIDDVRDFAFEVALHHRGESLLHPQAAELITYAVAAGLTVKLHTNGVPLSEEMARRIVDSGLHRLSVSFDGFCAEDYERIRRGADFAQVLFNIRRLLEIRQAHKKRRPAVAIELIRLAPGQVEEEKLRRFRRSWRGLGLDQLLIKEPHNWAGYLGARPKPVRRYSPCTFPWNALLVLWNGDVSPCAQDFFATTIVGNVAKERLREIWNGEPMQRLRRALAAGRTAEYEACRDCDRLWRRRFLGIPAEYLQRLIFRRLP